ncbi:MAG TPA: hypothetical protein VF733_03140 [Candidatus Saccharimonadales bacterium]
MSHISEHDPSQHPPTEQLPAADLRYAPWLGRSAVRLEQARVEFAQSCAVDDSGEVVDPENRVMMDRGRNQIQRLIEEARHTLAEAPRLRHGALAANLDLQGMPGALHNALLGYNSVPGTNKWIIRALNSVPASRKWLTNRLLMHRFMAKRSDGSFIASDETALNVLQWHNYRMAHEQAIFERLILPYKQKFVESVYQAAAQGWLLPTTVKNLDRLEKTGIYVSDGTDTLDKNWAGCMAMNRNGSYTVSLLPRLAGKTLGHELVHVLEGVSTSHPETGAMPILSHPRGLRRLFSEDNEGMKILGETITELVALCLRRGRYPTRFALPKRDSYSWGLPLVQALATAGRHPIAPHLFIHAHLEDDAVTKALGSQSAVVRLGRAFQEAFPYRDVIEDIANLQPEPEAKEPMRQPIINLAKKLRES